MKVYLAGGTIQAVLFRGTIIGIVVIIAQFIGRQISPYVGTAMAFSTITLCRILQTLPATLKEIGLFSNMYVIYAIIACLLIYGITLLPFMRPIFDIPLEFGIYQLGICVLLAIISTLIMEIIKFRKSNER